MRGYAFGEVRLARLAKALCDPVEATRLARSGESFG
jgi:hypothetical protein